MKGKSSTQIAAAPPEGFTLQEQGRWWASHPAEFQRAFATKTISQEVLEAIFRAAKDNDLAMKVIDRTKVPGLKEEERSRIFELLTCGGIYGGRKKDGPKPKTRRNLRIAIAIDGITDPRERNRIAREMAGDRYPKDSSNVSKLLNEVGKTRSKWNEHDLVIACAILQMDPDFDPTEEELGFLVEIFKHLIEEGQDVPGHGTRK